MQMNESNRIKELSASLGAGSRGIRKGHIGDLVSRTAASAETTSTDG